MKGKNDVLKKGKEFSVFYHLRNGLKPSTIARKEGVTKQLVNYYLRRLEAKGFIERVAGGGYKTKVKEYKIRHGDTSKNFGEVRGHSFVFVLQIPLLPNWGDRHKFLERNSIPFKSVGIYKSNQSIVFRGCRVWLCKRSLVVFFPAGRSYFENNSFRAKAGAVSDFLGLIRGLERLFKCSLRVNHRYNFRVSKQHYSLVKNELATSYLDQGKKLSIVDQSGEWALIDNSFNLEEFETTSIKSDVDSVGVQKYFNSHRRTDFKVTPEFILEGFKKLIDDRDYYADNLKTHVEAINELGKAVNELTKIVKELKNGKEKS